MYTNLNRTKFTVSILIQMKNENPKDKRIDEHSCFTYGLSSIAQ